MCFVFILIIRTQGIYLIFKQSGTTAPREPWHDLHCKIEGPAAYDVLKNFEQRWQGATQKVIETTLTGDDPSSWVLHKDDPNCWNVQVKHASKQDVHICIYVLHLDSIDFLF